MHKQPIDDTKTAIGCFRYLKPHNRQYAMPSMLAALIACVSLIGCRPLAAHIDAFTVLPSTADPGIKRFNQPNFIAVPDVRKREPELLVFMPGTYGKPQNIEHLLKVGASQGYRVVGLEYNNEPAVVNVCAHNPLADCAANFRQTRIFGGESLTDIDTKPGESIVDRLVSLILFLERSRPNEHWGHYLTDGQPNWSRIVIAGVSQGAGMAAYIAKTRRVARVVLFSGPWDHVGESDYLAPWLYQSAVTPSNRWYGEYHQLENTASLIAAAYKAMKIPSSNALVLRESLPPQMQYTGDNPYHVSTVVLPDYVEQWKFLLGESP